MMNPNTHWTRGGCGSPSFLLAFELGPFCIAYFWPYMEVFPTVSPRVDIAFPNRFPGESILQISFSIARVVRCNVEYLYHVQFSVSVLDGCSERLRVIFSVACCIDEFRIERSA